ncbi:hypothetical protein HWV62_33641 [Athelia sp. TMB]|nr:hypothetical protein HWV62_33641 [Athelia sp. TMB]
MDTSDRPLCLPGTRMDVLRLIQDWVNNRTSSECVLWLYGLAGSGKSTIAATLAQHYRESGQLGAFLAFDRSIDERKDPKLVVRTIAFQTGTVDLRIGEKVSESFAERPSLLSSPLAYQYQTLLAPLQPAIADTVGSSYIVVVLDALDECGTPESRESLLKILVEDIPNISTHIRFIITSRKEFDIHFAFGHRAHIRQVELDLTSKMAIQDIASYLRHQLVRITRQNGLEAGWPGEPTTQALLDRTNGLFIWASTSAKFLDGYNPKKQLKLLLNTESASGAEAAIDTLYRTALMTCGEWGEAAFVQDFKNIMGIILVARIPLSTAAIDDLSSSTWFEDEDWQSCVNLIGRLGSVLISAPQNDASTRNTSSPATLTTPLSLRSA